jgi:hypothetical protein
MAAPDCQNSFRQTRLTRGFMDNYSLILPLFIELLGRGLFNHSIEASASNR